MFKNKREFVFFIVILIIFLISMIFRMNNTSEAAVSINNVNEQIVKINLGENIQEKIDESMDGSTLVISAGEYIIKEPIVIEEKKNITIMGDKDVWIFGNRVDFQIFIIKDSENITIKNIKACHKLDAVTLNTKVNPKRIGSVVDIENCTNITLENSELEGCGVYGIYAVNTNILNIYNCYLHNNSWRALGLFNTKNITNVVIKDCTIINNTDFLEKEGNIYIQFEGKNVIRDNSYEQYKNSR